MALPRVNQDIQLSFENEVGSVYVSKVVEVSEDSIYFALPTRLDSGHYGVFTAGDVLSFNYRAVDDSACNFRSEILGQEKRGGIPCFYVARPPVETIHRTQMRNFVRVPVPVNARLHFQFPDHRELGQVNSEILPYDLSGGGISLLAPKGIHIEPGKRFKLSFCLPETNHGVTCIARLIRSSGVGDSLDHYQRLHCAFESIADRDRQYIVQYVFRRQIELKNRGQLGSL